MGWQLLAAKTLTKLLAHSLQQNQRENSKTRELMGWNKGSLAGKGKLVYKKSKTKEFINFPSSGHMFDQVQERRAPASKIVAWEIKQLNPSVFLLYSSFPEFLLLNTLLSYGMGYSFDHWGSAVLAASFPIFLLTPSILTVVQGRKRQKAWHSASSTTDTTLMCY